LRRTSRRHETIFLDNGPIHLDVIYTSVVIFSLSFVVEDYTGASVEHVDYTVNRRLRVTIFLLRWGKGSFLWGLVGVVVKVVVFLGD
jgi:hypothetical protein